MNALLNLRRTAAMPEPAEVNASHAVPMMDEATIEALRQVTIGMNAVPLLSPLAGVGQYTWRLISELQRMQLHPWLFYGTAWGQDIRTAAPPGVQTVKNAIKKVVPRPYLLLRLLQQARFSTGARRHAIRLYHEPAFLAYRFAGPTVVTVHDLSWIRHPETHPLERVRVMNRVMPRAVRDAAHIVVDSEFVRGEVMSHYGIPAERVTTVLLAAAPEFQPVDSGHGAALLARFGLADGQYLLAVGTLEPRKNLATVLAAYAQLPDAIRRRYPLVITGMSGWGMQELSRNLRQMVERGEVRLTGFVPQQELPALYSGARLFVYASLYEGFGMPPLEAMACGTPVIVSNRASLPEVVGGAGLQVEPLDGQALAQQMRCLIEDDALRDRLSAAGLERARRFTWRRCALETLAIYRKVLE